LLSTIYVFHANGHTIRFSGAIIPILPVRHIRQIVEGWELHQMAVFIYHLSSRKLKQSFYKLNTELGREERFVPKESKFLISYQGAVNDTLIPKFGMWLWLRNLKEKRAKRVVLPLR